MKKSPQQSVTSLPPSPDDERRGRMLRYAITMGIRTLCVVIAIVVPFWWRWIFAAGAIVLPYVAVVAANTVSKRRIAPVERPGGLVPIAIPRPIPHGDEK